MNAIVDNKTGFSSPVISVKKSRLGDPRVLQFCFDVVALWLSFFLYQLARQAFLIDVTLRRYSFLDFLVVGSVACVYWILILWFGGLYRSFYARSPFEEFFAVLRQTFIGSAIFFIFIFLSSSDSYQQSPRFIFVVYWILTASLMCVARFAARRMQRRLRTSGRVKIPVLLIATKSRIAELFAVAKSERTWGYSVLGAILVGNDSRSFETPSDLPILGEADKLVQILSKTRPDEVVLSVDDVIHSDLLQLTAICVESGAKVKIVPDLYEIFSGQARTHHIHGTSLIEVSPELMQPWEVFVKRLLDIMVSLATLLVGLPIWLLIATVVKLSSSGPVFFVQQRVGRNGVEFPMLKFRSMTTDTERGPTWTAKNDPRVTKVGWFIRKTHLDEIPQMINVLQGHMSLVGPRPEVPFFVEKYSAILPYYRRRLKVRPGITGWWQVKTVSNDESVEEIKHRLKFDFYYIENISFRLDLEILIRTIFVMIKGHGTA